MADPAGIGGCSNCLTRIGLRDSLHCVISFKIAVCQPEHAHKRDVPRSPNMQGKDRLAQSTPAAAVSDFEGESLIVDAVRPLTTNILGQQAGCVKPYFPIGFPHAAPGPALDRQVANATAACPKHNQPCALSVIARLHDNVTHQSVI